MDPGLKGMIAFGPATVVAVGVFHLDSWTGVAAVCAAAAFVFVVVGFSGTAITLSRRHLLLWVMPFWAVKISREEVQSVETETVRPFEDFGGWGIKGRSRKRGLLLCVGGTEVIAITTKTKRRYLVSVREGSGRRVRDQLRDLLA